MIRVSIQNRGVFTAMANDAAMLDADIRAAIKDIAREYNRIVAMELARPKSGRVYGETTFGAAGGRQRYRQVRKRVELFGGKTAMRTQRVAIKGKQTIRYRASAPGEAPARFSGNLIRGLRIAFPSREKGYGARVFTRKGIAGHRHLLEFGTQDRYQPTKKGGRRFVGRVLPRPIWSPMQKRALDDLQRRILRVIDSSAAFRGGGA
jgi:hypothetical protein